MAMEFTGRPEAFIKMHEALAKLVAEREAKGEYVGEAEVVQALQYFLEDMGKGFVIVELPSLLSL